MINHKLTSHKVKLYFIKLSGTCNHLEQLLNSCFYMCVILAFLYFTVENDPRKVIVDKMALKPEGRPEMIMDLRGNKLAYGFLTRIENSTKSLDMFQLLSHSLYSLCRYCFHPWLLAGRPGIRANSEKNLQASSTNQYILGWEIGCEFR